MGEAQARAGAMRPVRELMEAWARWRVYRARDELGYGRSILARVIDGLPTLKCRGCAGKGETLIKHNGSAFWNVCATCQGSGRIIGHSTDNQINPAFIHGSKPGDPDEISPQVDRAVCRLAELPQIVVMQEYTRNGTQEIKAIRIGVSERHYRAVLSSALDRIEADLAPGFGLINRRQTKV